MAWNNQAVSLIILTEQTTGFSGMFGYSPAVGHGSLIFSVSADAGTDSYGNAYPQGISSSIGQLTVNIIESQSLSANPGPILLYGNSSSVSTVIPAGASGNWTAPAGITSVTGTLIAGGGAGYALTNESSGGGGGECAVQTFTVVPASNYAYVVGTAGQKTTFITGTANPGLNATNTHSPGAGGSGSSASVHYNGGNGGNGDASTQAGGGGSSAGPMQPGNAGGLGSAGAAVPGGGAGGYLANGSVPGGGGSGLGTGVTQFTGGGGQLTLNYSSTGTTTLQMALASTAGSDGLGNSWSPGFTLEPLGASPQTPGTGCVLFYKSGTLNALGPSGTTVALAAT